MTSCDGGGVGIGGSGLVHEALVMREDLVRGHMQPELQGHEDGELAVQQVLAVQPEHTFGALKLHCMLIY